jgi:long-chain acyl-CoA synthetase
MNRPANSAFPASATGISAAPGFPGRSSSRPTDYSAAQSIPEIWAIAAQRKDTANQIALHDPHSSPEIKITYSQLWQQIQQFAAGLQALGLREGEHIALFADNSPRWLIADQGMMTAGMVNVVRSAQADRDELLFILADSDSVAIAVQDQATLKKLYPNLNYDQIKLAILLSDEQGEEGDRLKTLNFSQILELGAKHPLQPVSTNRETLATLMYTSGTSGTPKGVMLTQGNLLSQVTNAGAVAQPQPGERVLSILPIWHSYERSFEYFIFSFGCTQIYTNIRQVKRDLKEFKPHYMVGVPRLWESIYEGIQKQFREQPANKQKLINFFLEMSQRYIDTCRIVQKLDLENLNPSATEQFWAKLKLPFLAVLHQLGDKLVYKQIRAGLGGEIQFVVSGGGSIAMHLENFFEIVGIEILGGYGLTETSPITHVRRPWRNVRGADGQPIPQTETRIVDPETRQPLPAGQQGLVLLRGAQVMRGYYKNPQATAKAIDSEGWFDTGDLGLVTTEEDLVITGRAKDTIVLTNGENIEPQPIENACLRSPYIDQIMLVGQDQRSLGALIVPNLEALEKWATGQNLQLQLPNSDNIAPLLTNTTHIRLDSKQIQDLYRQELNREVKNRPGYRPDDRIGTFRLILEPFSIENGTMTQTLKIRRAVVMERYHDMIDGMFV